MKAANVVAEDDASAGCSEKTQPSSFVFECCLPYVCPEPVLVIVRFLGSNGLEWQKEKTSFFFFCLTCEGQDDKDQDDDEGDHVRERTLQHLPQLVHALGEL